MADSRDTEERLAEVLGEWFERRDTSEPLDPDELIRRHPEIAAELRTHFRFLDRTLPLEEPADDGFMPGSLGGYRIEEPVGEGGMGRVYRGRDATGATVAVKVLRPHLFHAPSFVKRFRREADVGRRIVHPHVVRTLDVGSETRGRHVLRFLVLEFVEGETLRVVLDRRGAFDETVCRAIGRQVASALRAIHEAGAVHRDLKPENVMLSRRGIAKVTDLGVARLQQEAMRVSQTGSFVGSIAYGAPEQFQSGRRADARTDLHALGVLLYEMSTGAHPYGRGNPGRVIPRILTEIPESPRTLEPALSEAFAGLVLRLLAKEPGDRPATAAEVESAVVT